MDTIKVTIDREKSVISVYNNGGGIPIEIHAKEKIYVPELIFGHLLTSSNYDDKEEKITGGRNGYGAKLCNIFSTTFTVETADSKSGKRFKQVFKNNMSVKGENFTRITFEPDLKKFNLTEIDDDLYGLLVKRVYDLAGCVRGIKVFLNDERIKIKNFSDYVKLYVGKDNLDGGTQAPILYEKINDRWEVAFTISDGQFNQVSFVNSICTIKGGTHVNTIADQIVAQLIDAVKKKDKKGIPLKPFQAKNHLWLFVNSAIVNPTFDSQTKETMTLRASAFGSKPILGEDFMKKVLKSGVVDSVLQYAKFKQDQLMKKTDGSGKRTRISGLAKLDDANNAGSKNASQCTLILTEGDSAKSLAVSGLAVVGRDNFGVFPLRGKLLNVREASHSQIMANAEISAIKQILGLQQGKVYTETSSLRYGHLMIMTDQDHDGSHIKGLIINFFDHFWPSLLTIPGFLLEFITPIVKATKGKGPNKREVSFFTIPEYETWKSRNDNGKGWVLKYYKGLGTSTTEDAKKYFSDLGKHLKPFQVATDESRSLIDMAFNKKKADDRKEWLRTYEDGTFMDHSVDEISLEDFVNKELILFSRADNVRSIPCAIDGLKPGQRKVLFACFKRNLKAEIKVAQLAGYVSEHSAYHHGEISLCMTIVNMAQSFVGSNNLNLLQPLGQFGTRLQGGKDAASPRYIFTNLTPLARAIFHPKDDPLLNYLHDDGQSIEPEWYIPVIPMILINGGEGIGTGWSTAIPNYNPLDIVKNIYHLMRDEEMEPMEPWYRGFEGSIVAEGTNKYRVAGNLRKVDSTTVEITELPLKSWTQNYKELLESWVTGTDKTPAWIKDYKEYHTDSKVYFVIHLSEENMRLAEKEGLESKFKISSSIATSNLVAHDLHGRIRKYASVHEIIKDFFDLRQSFYHKRKDYILAELTADHLKIENRVRFVTEIVTGKLIVHNRKKIELLNELKQRGYDPIFKNGKGDAEETEDESQNTTDHGYDYLLSMPIWSLTMEKIEALMKEKREKESEIQALLSQTPIDLWRTDLDAFLVQWEAFESEMLSLESVRPDNSTQAGGKTKGKKTKTVDAMIKKKITSLDSDDDDDFEVKKVARPIKVSAPKKLPKIAPAAVPESVSAVSRKMNKNEGTNNAKKTSVAKKTRQLISSDDDDFNSEKDSSSEMAKRFSSNNLKKGVNAIKSGSESSDIMEYEPAPSKMKKDNNAVAKKLLPSKRSSPPCNQNVDSKKIALGGKKAVAGTLKKTITAKKAKNSSNVSTSDAEGTFAEESDEPIVKAKPVSRSKKLAKPIIIESGSSESEESVYSVYSSDEN